MPGHLRSRIPAFAPILIVLAGGLFDLARAQTQVPCDSITGSGKISVTTSAKGSFALSGGVRQGAFWGQLTYQDAALGLTVDSTSVTKYSAGSTASTRVIEGAANTNLYGNRVYRVTAADNHAAGTNDTFKIELDNGYLRQGTLTSGDIKLHDGNKNSVPPPGFTCAPSGGAPPDTTPPTATITYPSSGGTVSGSITVTANASDNVSVAGVQFKLDGADLGPEDTTAPYSATWDTTTAGNGSHTLTAVARDGAGNTATSSPVTVTVSNGPLSPAGPVPDTVPPTVAITSPTSGSTVSGPVTVSASALDDVGVVGVQFKVDGSNLGPEDTTAPYSITWDSTTAANGSRTLTAVARDAAGNTGTSLPVSVNVSNVAAAGDLFVALTNGQVQWRNPDGSLKRILTGTSDGQSSSLSFDAAHNLYVPHWYSPITGAPGNMIERFDVNGNLLGTFGGGYNCNPSSVTFDAVGNVYVGQADCTGDILKFSSAGALVASFDVPTTVRGTDHVYLATDGCTMFYASRDKNIYRYNVCTNARLPNFNVQPLPGSSAYHLVILPGGGVLVADAEMIVRLDAAGNQVQTYNVAGQSGYLYGGVDFVGDGTFWASNGYNGNVYRFDIQTGAVLASFNTLSGDLTAAGVAVRR